MDDKATWDVFILRIMGSSFFYLFYGLFLQIIQS